MPRITLTSSFKKDLLSVFTVSDLKLRYLAGLPLPDSITDEMLEFNIEASIVELENFLGVRLAKTIILETKDFANSDWRSWGYLHTSYPIVCPVGLSGVLGTVGQINYPRNWLSTKHTNDNRFYSRVLHQVPTVNATHSESLIYSGIIPHVGYNGAKMIPNYWYIEYITGWDTVPLDLVNLIGMLTSVKVLQPLSDALMNGTIKKTVNNQGQQVLTNNGSQFGGIGFGMSSKSISIDGLSQSYSSYINGQTGAWGARLKQYADMLNRSMPGSLMSQVYDQYSGIVMSVC